MKTSETGISLICQFEGMRLKAYQDSVGVWTVGYGHTSAAGGLQVTKGTTLKNPLQAREILAMDLLKYEAAVAKALKHIPNQNQFDAMVSLCFNIGPGNFSKSSVLRWFNSGIESEAADAFLKWDRAGGKTLAGLTKRRKAERELFLLKLKAKD